VAIYINSPGASIAINTGLRRMNARISTSVVKSLGDIDSIPDIATINGVDVTGDKTAADYGLVTLEEFEPLTVTPTINGVEVKGDKTTDDFGIMTKDEYEDRIPSINGVKLDGDFTGDELGLINEDENVILYSEYEEEEEQQ